MFLALASSVLVRFLYLPRYIIFPVNIQALYLSLIVYLPKSRTQQLATRQCSTSSPIRFPEEVENPSWSRRSSSTCNYHRSRYLFRVMNIQFPNAEPDGESRISHSTSQRFSVSMYMSLCSLYMQMYVLRLRHWSRYVKTRAELLTLRWLTGALETRSLWKLTKQMAEGLVLPRPGETFSGRPLCFLFRLCRNRWWRKLLQK